MLATYIDSLTEESIIEQAQLAKGSSKGVETALSLMVLRQAGRFSRDLVSSVQQPGTVFEGSGVHAEAFDAVVFETAAFLHYSMMARYLVETTEEGYDGLSDELLSNHTFLTLRGAYHATGQYLQGRTAFPFSSIVYNTIAFSYAASSQQGGFIQRFESLLLTALASGIPASLSPQHTGGLSHSIDALTVAMRARAFALSQVPAFEQVSENAIRNARALGFAY
jgi:hypothetical protein